MQTKDST